MTSTGKAEVGLALERYRGEALDRSRAWADLPTDERRRRAVVAAQHLDAAALWSLTEAHTLLYGAAGAKLSPRTVRAYREAVTAFLGHCGHAGVGLIRPARDMGPLWVRGMEARGLSPSSVRVHLAGVRALFRALRWAGATEADPFSDTRAAKDKTAPWDKRQPYSEDEVATLLDVAGPRDRALILLCGHGGLRLSEALSLSWADVDLSGGALTVKHGKGGKLRRVKLSASLNEQLQRLRSVQPDPAPSQLLQVHPDHAQPTAVLPSAQRDDEEPAVLDLLAGDGGSLVIGASQVAARERLKALCNRAGVTYRGFHALRHYAGTRLVRQTGSLEHAARHLGHASIETTRVYAKWSEDALGEALAGW